MIDKYSLGLNKKYIWFNFAGDIDFVAMQENYGLFGVIFYFIFIYVMIFIVMNMFFTIMGDAFAKTKEQIAIEGNQYEILGFILSLVKVLKHLICMFKLKHYEQLNCNY